MQVKAIASANNSPIPGSIDQLTVARADVAKCVPTGGCGLCKVCLRNLRPIAPYQTYATFPGWRTDDCEGFDPLVIDTKEAA